MSSYLESEIRESRGDERLEHVAYLSIWSLIPKLLLGSMILVAAIVAYALWPAGAPNGVGPAAAAGVLALLAMIPLGSALITFYTTEIGVTNRRVLYKTGFVRRRTFEMVLEKVESLWIDQSVLGRPLRYGTIRVAAASDENIVIVSVAEPFVLKRQIDEAKNLRLESRARASEPSSTIASVEPAGA